MLTIGLTGKTGAGKSTVALWLKGKGCYIIDGDVIARQITEKGSPVLTDLQRAFGEDILDENGELITESAFLDKTIDVVGIVDYFSGEYQIKVFSTDDITVH